MEEIKKNGFRNGIEKNDRTKIKIQKPTTAKKHQNNHAKKKQNFEHHANKKKQKFNVHVASILWEKKKITIVVMLLITLKQNMKKQYKKLGINY